MDYGDDGFLLNVHTLEPSHSRKLSGKSNKVRSWSGKKAAQVRIHFEQYAPLMP